MPKNRVVLSSAENTPAGDVLEVILYARLLKVFRIEEYNGCPYDGGFHKLVLFVEKKDANAFIDLCEEALRKKYGEEKFKKFIDGFAALRAKAAA